MAKIRHGFVSNSSSSSFIIGCSKIPTTIEEAKEIWFDGEDISERFLTFMFKHLKEIDLDINKILDFVDSDDSFDPWKDEDNPEFWAWNFCRELKELLIFHEEYMYDYDTGEQGSKEFRDFVGKDWDNYQERYNAEQRYFNSKIFKEKLIEFISEVVDEFKECNHFMQVEVSDDFNGDIEYSDEWKMFQKWICFSHH